MVVVVLIFWGTSILFFKMLVPTYFPLRCACVSFLHIFTLIIVIQMGVVWFAISGWLVILSTFGHLNTFFRKMSAHVLYLFIIRSFLLFLIELWEVYILDINTLSDIWFANIFLHYIIYICHFIFIISFAMWNLFSLL